MKATPAKTASPHIDGLSLCHPVTLHGVAFKTAKKRRARRGTEGPRDREREGKTKVLFSPSLGLSVPPSFFVLFVSSWFVFLLPLFATLEAHAQNRSQSRPTLRNATRDRYAGRFLFVPRDKSPQAFQQARLLARIADHELITPPFFNIGAPAQVTTWLKEFDLSEADGAIVSLDAIDNPIETLRQLRAREPQMPIFAFLDAGVHAPEAMRLASEATIDYLLISSSAELAATMAREIETKALSDCVAVDDGRESAGLLLLARMLNRRFGYAPKFVPAYSSNPQAQTVRYGAKTRIIGGWGLAQTPDAATVVDGILFVHTAQTGDAQRIAFVDALERTLARGARIALIDVSESVQTKDALMEELRRRKLLDRVFAYASSDPLLNAKTAGDAANRAVSHLSTLLVGITFLRDNLLRMRRIDNSQVTLLLNRYLRDWAFPSRLRPTLEVFLRDELKVDPEKMGGGTERAAAFAAERLRPIADELFNQQFRGNGHVLLLSRGERVYFELKEIQRFGVRFASPRLNDLEILASVYSAQLNFPEPPANLFRATWELKGEQIDERVQRLIDSIAWEEFNTDSETVEVNIAVAPAGPPANGYRIVSQRKRKQLRIQITAASQEAAFYAIARLEQAGADGALTKEVQITESPALARRGIVDGLAGTPWSHYERLEMIRFLGHARMNRYYFAPDDKAWDREYSPRALERIRQLARTARGNFIELVYTLRPAADLTYTDSGDLAALQARLDELAAIGITRFAIAFDQASMKLASEADRAKFPTPAAAHADLINQLWNHLKQKGGEYELSLLPASAAHQKDLAALLPPEVFFLRIDSAMANQGREWRVFSGLDRAAQTENAAGLIAVPPAQMRAAKFSLAAWAQYAWNPGGYNASQAQESALNLLYEGRARAAVRTWLQARNPFDSLLDPSIEEIEIAPSETNLAELQKAIETIAVTRDQGLLRGELAQILVRARTALEQVRTQAAFEKLPNGNYRRKKQ